MQKIKTEDFQKKLQEINPNIMIIPNSNRPGVSNMMLNGIDICPWIPSFEIQDERSPDYVYNLRDMPIPLKTTEEIKEILKLTLNKLEDKDYADVLFDTPLELTEEVYGQHKA